MFVSHGKPSLQLLLNHSLLQLEMRPVGKNMPLCKQYIMEGQSSVQGLYASKHTKPRHACTLCDPCLNVLCASTAHLQCVHALEFEAKGLLDDVSKARLGLFEGRQNGMPQSVVLLLLVVGIICCLAMSSGSAGLIAWLIKVGIIHKNHTLNTDQYLCGKPVIHQPLVCSFIS